MAFKIRTNEIVTSIVIVRILWLTLNWYNIHLITNSANIRAERFVKTICTSLPNSGQAFLKSDSLIELKTIPLLNQFLTQIQSEWKIWMFIYGLVCLYKLFFADWSERRKRHFFLSVAAIGLFVQTASYWVVFHLMSHLVLDATSQVVFIAEFEKGTFLKDDYTANYLNLIRTFHVTLLSLLQVLKGILLILVFQPSIVLVTYLTPTRVLGK